MHHIEDKLIYNYIINEMSKSDIMKVDSEMFSDENIQKCFTEFKSFIETFEEKPTKTQLKEILKVPSDNSVTYKVEPSVLEVIYDVNLSDYDENWVENLSLNYIKWHKLKTKLSNGFMYLKGLDVDVLKIDEYIENFANIINTTELYNFAKDLDMGKSFSVLDNHFPKYEEVITTNHKWVDDCLGGEMGGYNVGTLNIYAACPNVGKSIFLCNDSANYIRKGVDVLHITLEMSDTSVLQRIGANLLNMNIDMYKDPSNREYINRRYNNLVSGTLGESLCLGKLYVKQYPTGIPNINDIENYFLKIRETGLNPKVVVIDYLNLMTSGDRMLDQGTNSYFKFKKIAEQLRAFALKYKVVVISATQLKQEATNMPDVHLNQISESSGVTATADTIYGIIQTDMMKQNEEYYLKILRIREGKGRNYRCRYDINYDKMILTESDEIETGYTEY